MEKAIVNMSKWSIGIDNDYKWNLSGYADNHPKLGKNVFVSYTSLLEKAYLENDIFIYVTKNTEYHCPLKYALLRITDGEYIDKSYVEKQYAFSLKDNTDINMVFRCFCEVRLQNDFSDFTKFVLGLTKEGLVELEEKEQKEKQRLLDIVKEFENSVYLEISKINDGDILAYNIANKQGIIQPYVHCGMVQDSILYMNDIVDFRYFPKGVSIQTYGCSENIDSIVIKNLKNIDIVFDDIVIKPNEIKQILKKD